MDKLDEIVNHMRIIGDQLVPYNFPMGSTILEDDLNILKTKQCVVDGYDIVLHFSRANYEKHYLESVQIYSSTNQFLAFDLVFKIATRFLGISHLTLVEPLKENRKIYAWTIKLDERGVPIPMSEYGEILQYNGINYKYLDVTQVDIY